MLKGDPSKPYLQLAKPQADSTVPTELQSLDSTAMDALSCAFRPKSLVGLS